jgi:hypothetical protein
MEIPITSGGPEVVVVEPAGELLPELEHAPSNSAPARHDTAVQPDRLTVFTICIPFMSLAALPEWEHVSPVVGGSWIRCFQIGNTVTVTVLVYPALVND